MKKIKRVKLDLAAAGVSEFITEARAIKTKMEGDTAFDTLDAKITLLGTAINTLEGANNSYLAVQQTVEQKAAELADARVTVEAILSVLGAGVETVSEGETTIVLRSGFDVQAERTPVGPLPAPQNVVARMSEHAGEVKLRWRTVRGARTYVIECLQEGTTNWIQAGITTRVNFTLTGLDSGKKYRTRVRAVGASGLSPWSDETVKMAA